MKRIFMFFMVLCVLAGGACYFNFIRLPHNLFSLEKRLENENWEMGAAKTEAQWYSDQLKEVAARPFQNKSVVDILAVYPDLRIEEGHFYPLLQEKWQQYDSEQKQKQFSAYYDYVHREIKNLEKLEGKDLEEQQDLRRWYSEHREEFLLKLKNSCAGEPGKPILPFLLNIHSIRYEYYSRFYQG